MNLRLKERTVFNPQIMVKDGRYWRCEIHVWRLMDFISSRCTELTSLLSERSQMLHHV